MAGELAYGCESVSGKKKQLNPDLSPRLALPHRPAHAAGSREAAITEGDAASPRSHVRFNSKRTCAACVDISAQCPVHSNSFFRVVATAIPTRRRRLRVKVTTPSQPSTTISAFGRVGMWRGGSRLTISVAAPFVWRCLSRSAVGPFPHSAHRTGQADLPHPALGQDLTPLFDVRRHLRILNPFWSL